MKNKDTNKLAEGCIQCLHYFGIFKYPLSIEEIYQFNPVKASMEELNPVVEKLVLDQKIFIHQGFYSLENNEHWVEERLRGNERARKLLERSSSFVKHISSFPFVRGIAISGSLSKGYASESPDIDYFIITAENRLWIARSLLHMFKKLTFISGHQHFYCMNYFIDTRAMTLEFRNQYSAIEMVTLLPVYNYDLVMEFFDQNGWIKKFLPNHPGIENKAFLIKNKRRICKSFFEAMLNILAPKYFNRQLMKLTDWKWRRKWKHHGYSADEYNRAFQTELHISKNHPVDYEKKVLESLNETQDLNNKTRS